MQIYSKRHTYYSCTQNELGEMSRESLTAAGGNGTFYSEEELRSLFSDDWELIEFDEVVRTSFLDKLVLAVFNVVAKKK